MIDKKEMTAPNVSVGADTEQSILKQTNDSITDFNEFDKSLDDYLKEMQKEFLQQLDPSHLKTVSMSELYNTVYQSKPPLIDSLLYPGTYIFAGAPKLGKSFLMAQLAYHISTGTPLWNYDVRKGTVLYLALEDDYHRLQERLYRMFGTESADNLYFSVSAGQLGNDLIYKYNIGKSNNLALYDLLINKIKSTILSVKFEKLASDMLAGREKFELLSLEEQTDVIFEILKILHCNVATGDLKMIGGSGKSGIVSINSAVSNTKGVKSVKLINQSVTGLYEQEIDLLK